MFVMGLDDAWHVIMDNGLGPLTALELYTLSLFTTIFCFSKVLAPSPMSDNYVGTHGVGQGNSAADSQKHVSDLTWLQLADRKRSHR